MDFYKAEYIWIDGTEPTPQLRSKGKIIPVGEEPPVWGFDGSSTNQAPGSNSDCVLNPVFTCPDPIRGDKNVLVLCEVLLTDMTPHPTNTRAALVETAENMPNTIPGSALSKNTPTLTEPSLSDGRVTDFRLLKVATIVALVQTKFSEGQL